jgi:hypothetical protein
MATQEQIAEAERLNQFADEVLSYNLQGGSWSDHIGAAEGLLAFYEASIKLQLTVAQQQGIDVDSEGSMSFFRHAAELHLRIAMALK